MKNYTPELLAQFVNDRNRTPFKWGQSDCSTLAADWAHELTGRDPAAAYRGKYDTALTAARMIKESGGFVALISKIANDSGWIEIQPLFAGRGCVAIITDQKDREAAGIVTAAGIACQGYEGIEILPMKTAIKAWRIT